MSTDQDAISTQIKRIIILVSLIHNVSLFLYHLLKKEPNVNNGQKNILSIIAYIGLFFIVIQTCMASINSFARIILNDDDSSINCQIIGSLNSFCYSIAKFTIYFLFLERLFGIFKASMLSFKKYHIYLSRIYYILILSLLFVFSFVFITYSHHPFDKFSCINHIPLTILIFVIFNDLFMTAVVSILFMRRLIALNNITPSNVSEVDQDLLNVLKKSALLAFIALFSSQICFIFIGIFSHDKPIWVRLDSMINSWCIILLFSKHSSLYQRLCVNTKIERICTTKGCLLCCSCHCCCKIGSFTKDNADRMDNKNHVKTDGKEQCTEIAIPGSESIRAAICDLERVPTMSPGLTSNGSPDGEIELDIDLEAVGDIPMNVMVMLSTHSSDTQNTTFHE